MWLVSNGMRWCASCVLRALGNHEPIRSVVSLAEMADALEDEDAADENRGIDRAAEDDYRAHSPSITGLYEAP
jgi:hypothetical protein